MAKSFDELRAGMSAERRLRSARMAQGALADLLMGHIRAGLGLGTDTDNLSLDDLRRIVQGLGGELEVTILLPAATIRIS